jgi:hypothetical protein
MLGPPLLKAREQDAAVCQSTDGSIGFPAGGAIGQAYPQRSPLATNALKTARNTVFRTEASAGEPGGGQGRRRIAAEYRASVERAAASPSEAALRRRSSGM